MCAGGATDPSIGWMAVEINAQNQTLHPTAARPVSCRRRRKFSRPIRSGRLPPAALGELFVSRNNRRMKKCSMCGWENAEERAYCQQCGGPVRLARPLSPEWRKRARVLARGLWFLAVGSFGCGVAFFVSGSLRGSLRPPPSGPAPDAQADMVFYTGALRCAMGAAIGYVCLRVASYLNWKSKGALE